MDEWGGSSSLLRHLGRPQCWFRGTLGATSSVRSSSTVYREISARAIALGIVQGIAMTAAFTYAGLKLGFGVGGSSCSSLWLVASMPRQSSHSQSRGRGNRVVLNQPSPLTSPLGNFRLYWSRGLVKKLLCDVHPPLLGNEGRR